MTKNVVFPQEKIDLIVERIIKLHRKNGGATVNLKAQNLVGRKLYAVVIFERKIRLPDDNVKKRVLPKEILGLFVKRNIDLLSDSLCVVGTWHNEETKAHFLEISIVLEDKKLAIEIGKAYNQISIYDLYNQSEIKLGGNDILPPDKKSVAELQRLKQIRSLIKGEKSKDEKDKK